MEIDAWDHKGKHYSGQGKNLKAALKDARRKAMIEHGISYLSLWLSGARYMWPLDAYKVCELNAPTVSLNEWRNDSGKRTDERRNL